MANNDAPKLNNYTFSRAPNPANVRWERILVQHDLSDGASVVYDKGYVLKGTLEWSSEGWLTIDDASNIVAMFNEATSTAKFYPRTDTYPTRSFNVQLVDYSLTPHMGHLQTSSQLYEGSISFESSVGEVTATAGMIF